MGPARLTRLALRLLAAASVCMLAAPFGQAATAAPQPAAATAEAAAQRFLGIGRYCESGRFGIRPTPAEAFQEKAFTLCARRDGRFRYVETQGSSTVAHWFDGRTLFSYYAAIHDYREYRSGPWNQPDLPFAHPVREPASRSLLFRWDAAPRGFEGAHPLHDYLASEEASTPEFAVFERREARGPGERRRLWLRREDGSVVRLEIFSGADLRAFVELASQRIDPPLTDQDLRYPVPLYVRFSPGNNPRIFLGLLFSLTALVASAAWTWLLADAARRERLLAWRRRAWRWQARAFASALGAIVLLGALTMVFPDRGHPPSIVVVIGIAEFVGVAFGLAAVATLASYPVQWLLRARP